MYQESGIEAAPLRSGLHTSFRWFQPLLCQFKDAISWDCFPKKRCTAMITAWSASCFGQLPQPLAALLVFCGRCGEFAHLREWLDERSGPAQLWDAAEAGQAYLSPWHEYAQALGGEYSRRVHHVIQFNSTLRFTILVHELSVNMKRSFLPYGKLVFDTFPFLVEITELGCPVYWRCRG